jgi:hypothetical protein
MSAPHKLSRKLQETLGPEASDAMIDWMNHTDTRLDELHTELVEFRSEVRADFAELRQEFDSKLTTGLGSLREEMRVGFAKVDAKFAEIEKSAAQRHADFMKWTLGFWVLSLATLAGTIIGLSNRLR